MNIFVSTPHILAHYRTTLPKIGAACSHINARALPLGIEEAFAHLMAKWRAASVTEQFIKNQLGVTTAQLAHWCRIYAGLIERVSPPYRARLRQENKAAVAQARTIPVVDRPKAKVLTSEGLRQLCRKHGVSLKNIHQKHRHKETMQAYRAVVCALVDEYGWSYSKVARALKRDRSTIMTAYGRGKA
jgi:hypothetical protein